MAMEDIHGLQNIHWIQNIRIKEGKLIKSLHLIYSPTRLGLATPGHLISAGFSQNRSFKIIFQKKATPLWPWNYPGFGTGLVVLFPQSL